MSSFLFRDGAVIPRNSTHVKFLLIAASCIFATTTGFDSALMSGLNIMPAYKKYFSLTATTKGLLTSATFIGSTPAAIIWAPITNKFGRKKSIIASAIAKLIGICLMASAQNFGMFCSGRVMLGFGSGISSTSAPVWLAETLPYRSRGKGLSFIYAVWYVGSLIAAGTTLGTSKLPDNLSWRVPAALQAIFSVICLAILAFTPESPRWLAYQGRTDEALEVVALCHSNGDINDPAAIVQYQEIVDTLRWEKEAGETLSYTRILKTPGARKRVLLSTSVAVITMLSGNNIILYYLGDMLENAGITSTDRKLQINICLSAFCLVIALVGSQCADYIGRKKLALCSVGAITVFIFAIGGMTKAYGGSSNNSGIYGTVAMIFLFQGSYSFGLTNLTVLYPPEVLNYSIRATGMAIWTLAVNGAGLLATFALPIGLAAISWKLYLINGVWDILEFAFIWFLWIETKGKTLEEIDAMIDGEKHSDVPDMENIGHWKIEKLEGVGSSVKEVPEMSSQGKGAAVEKY